MRGSICLLALCTLSAFLYAPLPGQTAPGSGDSLKNRPPGNSLKQPDSSAARILTVDSTKMKPATAAPQQPKTPRSSTLRTVERQTAPHAAKNAPHVKNAKPTTR